MQRVAFLGLGIMGSRMAAQLTRQGFDVTVWNRTAERAEMFAATHDGVSAAASPKGAAADAEMVVSMVVDGAQVESILLGPDGVADGAPPGTLCIDCSTIGPGEARRIGGLLAERSLTMVDAPVTGSAPRADDGTLTIMAGGSDSDFGRAQPVLEALGSVVVHAGPLGQGQLVKVINNAVAATNAAVVGEALLVASKAGANLDALIKVMSAGSGGSAMLDLKARPMRRHDYTTLFKLDHMLKDVRLCLEAAEEAGIEFDFAERSEQILAAAAEQGHGNDDFASLIEALEHQLGTHL